MKVYEAIALLEGMDQNKEVTVTMGAPGKRIKDEVVNVTAYSTQWVDGKDFWPQRPNITCKMH